MKAGSGAQGLIDEVTALTLAIATTNPALLKAASNNDTDWSSIVVSPGNCIVRSMTGPFANSS